jgi:hypothetical protein
MSTFTKVVAWYTCSNFCIWSFWTSVQFSRVIPSQTGLTTPNFSLCALQSARALLCTAGPAQTFVPRWAVSSAGPTTAVANPETTPRPRFLPRPYPLRECRRHAAASPRSALPRLPLCATGMGQLEVCGLRLVTKSWPLLQVVAAHKRWRPSSRASFSPSVSRHCCAAAKLRACWSPPSTNITWAVPWPLWTLRSHTSSSIVGQLTKAELPAGAWSAHRQTSPTTPSSPPSTPEFAPRWAPLQGGPFLGRDSPPARRSPAGCAAPPHGGPHYDDCKRAEGWIERTRDLLLTKGRYVKPKFDSRTFL